MAARSLPLPLGRRQLNPGAGFAIRVRTRLQRGTLDSRIAAGADRETSPEVAQRCLELVSRRARRRLARALESLIAAGERRGPVFTSAIAPDPLEVHDARPALTAVMNRLVSEEDVTASGIVKIARLLTDGNSALYRPLERGEFGDWLRAAAAELERRGDAS
jgi:hypothetical protein